MLPNPVPARLTGTVIPQYVRCGKPNCRCAQGVLHGPYYYRFWRDSAKRLHKQYVRPADLDAVRAACAARQDEAHEVQALLAEGARVVRWYLRGVAGRLSTPVAFGRMLELP